MTGGRGIATRCAWWIHPNFKKTIILILCVGMESSAFGTSGIAGEHDLVTYLFLLQTLTM